MFGMDDPAPVERFAGHENVVKDFVWRMRGGNDSAFDDREFQLVTWSKDRTLRIWPVSREAEERVGWQYGAPIEMLVSRRGAPDVTYTKEPSNTDIDTPRLLPPLLPLTVCHHHPNTPSNLTRQKCVRPVGETQQGMTRGGNKVRRMDQLEWLTKVVKNAPSPDSSSLLSSRMTSVSRTRRPPASRAASQLGSRSESAEGTQEWKSLKDEVVAVSRMYPRPKINFEKVNRLQKEFKNGDYSSFCRLILRITNSQSQCKDHGPTAIDRHSCVYIGHSLKTTRSVQRSQRLNLNVTRLYLPSYVKRSSRISKKYGRITNNVSWKQRGTSWVSTRDKVDGEVWMKKAIQRVKEGKRPTGGTTLCPRRCCERRVAPHSVPTASWYASSLNKSPFPAPATFPGHLPSREKILRPCSRRYPR